VLVAVGGLLTVPGALAGQSRALPLTVTITGKGIVRLSGGRQVACAASCKRTVSVRAGSKITLSTQPSAGWKFGAWAGACRGTSPACKVRITRAARVGVTFIAPGDRANPFPLGQTVKLSAKWQMKVISATLNATDQVVALKDEYGDPENDPPPPGAQYTLVNISGTYIGGGSSYANELFGAVRMEGVHNATYYGSECIPPPPRVPYRDVFSGQTVTGNLCFRIAANDADSLMLSVSHEDPKTYSEVTTWFALR
jgi:hypothetical protein